MEINIKWTDKAADETSQRIYVSSGFSGDAARHYFVMEVGADLTAAQVPIPDELAGGAVFITVTAVRETLESIKKAFYVTQQGAVTCTQFAFVMSEIYKRYKEQGVPAEIATVSRGALPLSDPFFMSEESCSGLLADGRVLSVSRAGNSVATFSQNSLLRTVVSSPLVSKLVEQRGVFDQNGRYWSESSVDSKVAFYAFDVLGVISNPVTLATTDSVGTMIAMTCDARNHVLSFRLLETGVVVVIDIDVATNTYKRFDTSVADILFSGMSFVLGSGRSVLMGNDTNDNTPCFAIYDSKERKFTIRRPRVELTDPIGQPCALGERVLWIGTRESVRGLHYYDLDDPNATIATREFVGLPISELSAPIVSPWGEWLVAVGSGVEGPKLLLVHPTDFDDPLTDHRFIVPPGGTIASGYNKLFRTGKYYFQYKADGSYVRYSFKPVPDTVLDPKYLVNNHQQGGSRYR